MCSARLKGALLLYFLNYHFVFIAQNGIIRVMLVEITIYRKQSF